MSTGQQKSNGRLNYRWAGQCVFVASGFRQIDNPTGASRILVCIPRRCLGDYHCTITDECLVRCHRRLRMTSNRGQPQSNEAQFWIDRPKSLLKTTSNWWPFRAPCHSAPRTGHVSDAISFGFESFLPVSGTVKKERSTGRQTHSVGYSTCTHSQFAANCKIVTNWRQSPS